MQPATECSILNNQTTKYCRIYKKSRKLNLKCGHDFGILAYNDTPSYEIIDNGITALTIDWREMGEKIAEFVLNDRKYQEYLPTLLRLRGSL